MKVCGITYSMAANISHEDNISDDDGLHTAMKGEPTYEVLLEMTIRNDSFLPQGRNGCQPSKVVFR